MRMLERIARAILDAERKAAGMPSVSEDEWETVVTCADMYPTVRLFDMARAAVETMREPTEVMVDSARFAGSDGGWSFESEYRAAIDAILSE